MKSSKNDKLVLICRGIGIGTSYMNWKKNQTLVVEAVIQKFQLMHVWAKYV